MAETKKRIQWGRQLEFIFTLIGFAVGLGNIWRFPYLCFKNGGGAFLLPYVICLLLLGIPIFALEIAFGQFGGKGTISIWNNANPIFKGLGYSSIIICIIMSIYYDVIIAWGLYYLFASMTDKLPWEDCNDCACQLYDSTNGTNVSININSSIQLNCTNFNGQPRSASEIYYRGEVLSQTEKLGDWGILKWDLSLCNLLSWIIVFIVLSKGIKSLGKIVIRMLLLMFDEGKISPLPFKDIVVPNDQSLKVIYLVVIFPYLLLTILLIRCSLLEGASEGIKYYLTPDLSRLTDATVWSDAAVQIFYSLGACQGVLTSMASYNKFNNNIMRDALVIPLLNCFTSFYAGFVVFSVLGYMAHERGLPVANVTQGGTGLAFIVYPEAVTKMPLSPLWAILFFFMLCTLGFSSQFSYVETAMTGLIDELTKYVSTSKRVIVFRASVCIAGFLLGLPMLTQGGGYLLDIVDAYILGFPPLLLGLFETIVLCWVYGFENFSKDIEAMIGRKPFLYFKISWMFTMPFVLVCIIGFKAYQYVPLTHLGKPQWAESLGWLISFTPIVCLPLWFWYYAWSKGLMGATSGWYARRNLNDSDLNNELPPVDYDEEEPDVGKRVKLKPQVNTAYQS